MLQNPWCRLMLAGAPPVAFRQVSRSSAAWTRYDISSAAPQQCLLLQGCTVSTCITSASWLSMPALTCSLHPLALAPMLAETVLHCLCMFISQGLTGTLCRS